MHHLARFWLVVLSLITGISALGFLTLSFLFPETPMFAVGSVERLLVVLVGAVSIGVVVWSSTTFGDVVAENPDQQRR
jgi:hypothetical protein